MWTYESSTGILRDDAGKTVGVGYSGHGPGVNNASYEDVKDVGPIPQGRYTIGAAHSNPKLGPMAMALTPCAGTDTHGRSGFYMHGDDVHHIGQELASEGCIIQGPETRERVSASTDRDLLVVWKYAAVMPQAA